MKIREARGRKVKTSASKYGHTVVFVPYEDLATCKPCLAVALRGSHAGCMFPLRPRQWPVSVDQVPTEITRSYPGFPRPRMRYA